VPIVPSRSGRIQELLGRLASASPAERDAAVAGLRLLGTRVLEPLGAFLAGAGREARLAALELLDGLDDRAALAPILGLVGDADEAVARRAIESAGARTDRRAVPALASVLNGRGAGARRREAALALVRLQAAGAVEALDPLAARLLDEREAPGLRVAIFDALFALHPPLAPATLRPLLKRLSSSPDPDLADRAASFGPGRQGSARAEDALLERLVAPGQTPEAVARTIAALARRGAPAIPQLARALTQLGPIRPEREEASSLSTRGALHEALAALDSRVALYDLREALEAHPRSVLPALLRAASRVGDASVVPALARAVAEDPALLDACAATLAAIVAREKLRRTSAALKAVRPEHRPAFKLLWDRAKGMRPR
jgi:HEAT repeat protein